MSSTYWTYIVVAVVIGVIIGSFSIAIFDRNVIIDKLRKEVTQLIQENTKCNETLQRQNEAIKSIEIDKKELDKKLSVLNSTAAPIREKIVERLVKDGSCENELLIIRERVDEIHKIMFFNAGS